MQALTGKHYESSPLNPIQLSRRLCGGHTSTRIYIAILLKRTVLGQVFHYEIATSNQLHNPANTRVMQAKVLGQLRHGVATGGKGRLNRSVAVVVVLLNVDR